MQILYGPKALSDFRINNLLSIFIKKNIHIKNIYTKYIYFIDLLSPLTSNEKNKLNELLKYDFNLKKQKIIEKLIIVVPRLGTISSWSSKATNIAYNCNLLKINRIERGIAYYIKATSLSSSELNYIKIILHNKMTENIFTSFEEIKLMFKKHKPLPMKTINVINNGRVELENINKKIRLGYSEDEITYLLNVFLKLQRNPTDVELYSFAQINSEHCRHKIFNANWIINKKKQTKSLFDMIKNTFKNTPDHVLSAYKDNAAIIKGYLVDRFFPKQNKSYCYHKINTHTVIKVETHNHPTAIAPWQGAATGSGGEIRDEGSTGRGAKPKVGFVGFSVSNLHIPDFKQPWEEFFGKPKHIASALDILINGSLGSATFNNEFGRPTLLGYFRTYEENVNIYNKKELKGYHKPIMLAGGIGNICHKHIKKEKIPIGTKIIVIGGSSMNIGVGGGTASSSISSELNKDLDFKSVQRENAEMERRCQEVINKCWQLNENNPILFIHDVGAGGLSNAIFELVNESGYGGYFELRKIPNDEPQMTPLELWCNESQERYILAIKQKQLTLFESICLRERTPFSIIGKIIKQPNFILNDSYFKNKPINLPVKTFLNNTPKTLKNVKTFNKNLQKLNKTIINLEDAIKRILRFPAVAEKTFLITIGDRSITGMVSRDQMVGPWQIPISNCAVTTTSFNDYYGESISIGEKAPISLINFSSSANMAVGEALTNLSCSYVKDLKHIKLSANWMVATNHKGEDAGLYEAVKSITTLCSKLNLAIIVGKDSLSMKTCWKKNNKKNIMTSPLSVVISAFGRVEDVRLTVTPELTKNYNNILLLIDLGKNNNALGGTALAQVYRQLGDRSADIRDVNLLINFFKVIQKLIFKQKILAYHDRSDGGLFVTLIEMAFAGHCGVNININSLNDDILSVLFNEELGVVIQIRNEDKKYVEKCIFNAGLSNYTHYLGTATYNDEIIINKNNKIIYKNSRTILRKWWGETTWQIQRIRDNCICADQEYKSKQDKHDPGLNVHLLFNIEENIAAPFILSKIRPKVAILREQGINSHTEMAAAFYNAGFDAVDVHMTDLLNDNILLDDFKVLVACGGFSYGDTLGAGNGWAKTILLNNKVRDKFSSYFNKSDTLSLGVCNGCQMMSNLRELIPGTNYWPYFTRNKSERFEARFSLVEIQKSPSIFLKDMEGSRIPIVVSHAEGRVDIHSIEQLQQLEFHNLVTMRFVNNYGKITEQYPANPNGSVNGITSVTSIDGRSTIMMPHPERVFRTINNSWHPKNWGEHSPWMRIFHNARKQIN
ncbi:phosphoribosylformylglycinamidine synthase [Candidatus Providencia siddallii]